MTILEFNLWARFFLAAAKAAHSWTKSKEDSWEAARTWTFLLVSHFPQRRQMDTSSENMEPQRQTLKSVTSLSLGRYHISEEYGFLLQNPLVRTAVSRLAQIV